MELSREQLARVWLQCAPMGAWARLEGLKEKDGGALGVWESFTPQYYELLGVENFSYLADLRASRCASVLRELDALGAYPLFLGDGDYPLSLASIPDPPDVLFVRGSLPKDFTRRTIHKIAFRISDEVALHRPLFHSFRCPIW